MPKLKLYTILLSILLLTGCSDRTNITVAVSSSDAAVESSSSVPEVPKPQKIRFIAAGDDLIHDAIYMQASKRAGGTGFDFRPAYSKVEQLVADADIAMINQETPLASKVAPLSNYPLFNSPTEVGDQLMSMGFDVISHANNHAYDVFEKGIVATLDYWDTQKDATVIGLHRNNEEKKEIDYLTKNDVKFAFLGYTQSTNGLQMPSGSEVGTTLLAEEEFILSQIKEAKANADVVVLSLHWGDENSTKPNAYQRQLATKLAEAGADLIVGHHSHVIQEGEYLTRSDGTTAFVIYSLGNFISAQREINNFAGGFLQVDFIKDFEKNQTVIDTVEFIPTVVHYGPNVREITIYPFSEYTPALANTHGIHQFASGFSYEHLQRQIEPVIASTKRNSN